MVVAAIIVGAVIIGGCTFAGCAFIAHNVYTLQQEIKYIFDLWQEHDTRWRRQ